ncbi:hypothetical protein H4R18_005331 [Coemansia javaensis]|uniref:Uncharacterized protein n=1 Tax=Coemansia javaensis TaxID=2761396 RepID=A0A9W8H9H6_9FUNG|nr:hypothetical protein H4R18_005331 [Coemansia javaensis]
MAQEEILGEIAEAKGEPQAAGGGRYIALLRQTAGRMLFSDPVFAAAGQPLPELPAGVEYIVVHPYTVPAQPRTLGEYMPPNALDRDASPEPEQRPDALPTIQDYGHFSSFLPARNSTLTSLCAADYAVLNGSDDPGAAPQVTEAELESAVELAQRTLGEAAAEPEVSPEMLRDLGLTPADIGMDAAEEPAPETAEGILRQNSALLVRLLELQDRRARSGDYGAVSAEEQAVATRLQASLARVVGASAPKDVRPLDSEIQRAAKLLLAGGRGSYAGTLPPQQRFAFMSNAAGLAAPSGATVTPMQRVPPPSQGSG